MDAEQAGGPVGQAGNAAAGTARIEGREAFRGDDELAGTGVSGSGSQELVPHLL